MIINFNFKKYLKYFVLFLLVYILLHSFSNVKAWTPLADNYIVDINTRDKSFLDFLSNGNADNLNQYYINNLNNSNFLTYYNAIKEKIAGYRGYNSFSELINDYYYITMFRVQNNNQRTLDIFVYLADKRTNVNIDNFSAGISVGTTSSTPNNNLEYQVKFGALYMNYYYYWQVDPTNFNTTPVENMGGRYLPIYCRNSYDPSSQCVATTFGNSTSVSLRTNTNTNVVNLFWDTNKPNLDFAFTNLSGSWSNSNYVYQKMTINNSDYIYTSVETIYNNFLDNFNIVVPNVQDLGNNSYGLSFNTVDNIFLDYQNNSSSSIRCPNDNNFVNDTCFLYSNDITNFDVNNTNVSNSAVFFLANNSILLDSSKYYVLTYRLYTSYNLDIFTTLYNLENDPTDYSFNIQNKYMTDYSLYKDYSIVFKPTHTGTGYLRLFDLVFSKLNTFTNKLNSDFNFGIFKTIKISEYNTLPTQSDVENEINNNNLTTISNNSNSSFFKNFVVDDHGLSSIILFPLNFVNSFSSYSCSYLDLPVQKIGNVRLTCISDFMNNEFSTIWNLYRLIFNGFIIYRILVNLYALIKNLYRPDNDRIEVADL